MTLTTPQLIIATLALIAIGLAIGRYLRTGTAALSVPNTPLGKVMRQVFLLSVLIYAGIFVTDWFFTEDKQLLNDTIVGVLIGGPIGWYGAVIAFHTTETQMEKPTDPEGKV